jgi:tetratricopeptide (TPR) repeat protein
MAPAPATEPAPEVHEAAPAAAPTVAAATARAAEPKIEAAPPPKAAITPHANTVARSNATRRSPVPAAAPAVAAASRRAAANAAAAHTPSRPATTAGERERVLAWLTARGPSPRAGMSYGAPAPATPAQVAAPAPAPAPMAAAAAAPIHAPALLPATVQPVAATAQEPAAPPLPPDFAARASTLLSTGWLTRAARRAEPIVSQVMTVAAQPDGGDHEDDIREAVSSLGGLMTDASNIGFSPDSFEARRLNDAAAQAYWRRGNVPDALDLQLKAFGANPLDATVAGQLAFLQLRVRPAQADVARQLALHALTLRDAKLQAARPEDWTTLAIANALLGRDRDARNAWFVALALAPNPETQCRAAISAYNKYGEALRPPVEAVLYRAYLSGRASRSPFCAWPPYWAGVAGGAVR